MQAIAVHGGAGTIPEKLRPEQASGIRLALEAGRRVLLDGGTALDAVIAAVVTLEDLPALNAGYGSALNAEGHVQLDAGLMEGRALEIGAVAAVADVRNPIRLCRVVLECPHIFFAGENASRLAGREGIERVEPDSLVSPRRLKLWQSGTASPVVDAGLAADTVGAVALDAQGDMAAGTSTGGTHGKPAGRVGDSPLPGGGYYADNNWGACSATGWGEGLARILAARRAIEGLERGLSPSEAARTVLDFFKERIPGGDGGLILLDPQGRFAAEVSTASMSHAWWSERDGEGIVV
jgi:L-asparaginase / beta-aspartyl-peptidase